MDDLILHEMCQLCAQLAKAQQDPHTICRNPESLTLHRGALKLTNAKSNYGVLRQLGHMLICCLYMAASQNFFND